MYTVDETTLLGIGEYGPDFSGQAVSSQIFGNGRDGDLVVNSTIYVDSERASAAGTAPAGQKSIQVENVAGFNIGDEILIIQTQGTGAGSMNLVLSQVLIQT